MDKQKLNKLLDILTENRCGKDILFGNWLDLSSLFDVEKTQTTYNYGGYDLIIVDWVNGVVPMYGSGWMVNMDLSIDIIFEIDDYIKEKTKGANLIYVSATSNKEIFIRNKNSFTTKEYYK